MIYIPGAKHKAADAVSRKPVGSVNTSLMSLPDDAESIVDGCGTQNEIGVLSNFLSSLRPKAVKSTCGALEAIQLITWEKVKIATSSDCDMEALLSFTESGFPQCKGELPGNLKEYFQYK